MITLLKFGINTPFNIFKGLENYSTFDNSFVPKTWPYVTTVENNFQNG